jgi:hypothetical protein
MSPDGEIGHGLALLFRQVAGGVEIPDDSGEGAAETERLPLRIENDPRLSLEQCPAHGFPVVAEAGDDANPGNGYSMHTATSRKNMNRQGDIVAQVTT